MKLLTNDNNVNTLKIIIASKWIEKSIEIFKDSTENLFKSLKVPKTVPQLILDSGTHIFSSNTAVKILIPPSTVNLNAVNFYLDLEASLIQPMSISFLSKAISEETKCFSDILDNLNHELQSKQFLTGDDVSAGDIVIWCSLYPLFTDPKFCNVLFENRIPLKNWFESFLKNSKVQEALKEYPIQNGLASFVSINSYKSASALISNSAHSCSKASITSTPEKSVINISEDEKQKASKAFNEKSTKFSSKKVYPVLPVPGEKNILITAALPYVNNVPHLGNLIGCVLSGDVFARYCRLRNYNTLYICGTDEYGTATETKALEEGLTPKEICDKYFQIHDFIYKWFNISFDYFGRTTTPQQTEICQDIFKRIYKNGYILEDSVEQLLCEKCNRFLADRFVEGTCPDCAFVDARGDQCDGCGHLINAVELIEPRCKLCKERPVTRQSKQFFLDLPKIEPLLKIWIEKSWTNWSHNAREISKAWLNEGLRARCITRDLKWGIPVPIENYENKVFYVWFDAPIGYISITKLYTEEWRKWWLPEADTKINLYQFMAKDNVPFHSVIFPASLIATKENYVKVTNIFATEYLNYEDGKFSKSRGIGVFGNDAQNTGIPPDVWRFYLLYIRPETQDSSFSWMDLAIKNNSELLNVLGNFINRALSFCEKTYNSIVPNIVLENDDLELIALVNREINDYILMFEKGKLREGIRHLLAIARLGNQFMQASQPWVLSKGSESEKKRCETVIGLCTNLSCLLAQLLDPYMPETSEKIRKQLNASPEQNFIDDKFRLLLPPGHKIGKPFPLFVKIEMDQIQNLKEKFGGKGKDDSLPQKNDALKLLTEPVSGNVVDLEAAVAAQGDLVRNMKKAGKDKSEWGPQVTVLLNLKQKLAEAQKSALKVDSQQINNNQEPAKNIEEMEEKVKKQGDVVRKLKESGADRSIWQPEVNVLLQLKKELAELKGEPLPTGKKSKK